MKKAMLVFICSLLLAANSFALENKAKKPDKVIKPVKNAGFFQLMANWVNGLSSPASRKLSLILNKS